MEKIRQLPNCDNLNRLSITKKIYADMIDYCKACFPNEACGILGGIGFDIKEIYMMTNIESSPVSYMMDASEQFRIMKDMRNNNLSLAAIFHSHPSSPAYPSHKDLALAFYEDSFYIIVSLMNKEPETRAFIIKGQKEIQEIEIFIK